MQNNLLHPSGSILSDGQSNEQLLAIIAQQQAIIEQQQAALKEEKAQSQEKDRYIRLIEEHLALAKIQKFGTSSEKLPFQADLFDEAELEIALSDLEDQLPDDELTQPRRKKKRNRGFSDTLPRKRIELRLSDEEREGATRTFFSKIKEELEFIPAQLNVLEYWQEKAVFSEGRESGNGDGEKIIAAQRPIHPLGKCFASTSLLSHIIVSKYADGLPLYRLEGILKRYGGEVSRTNMAQWIVKLTTPFQPLINLMREIQNSGCYTRADETRIQVLKEDGKTAQSDKWMWVTCGGPPQEQSVLFEYDPSRGGAVAKRILQDFNGILQADGYSGYSEVCRKNRIKRIGCWDHARRKFVEAEKVSKDKQRKGKTSKTQIALSKIRKLYRIEKEIKALNEQERYRIRQEQSVPILNDFKQWLEKNHTQVIKGSLTRKAMEYTLNQWEHLIGYCDYGYLEISNAKAENAIRPFAVGRRAWLFADTPQGARASAVCYSLIESAKTNQLEPYTYIQYILNHIGAADTLEKLEALLPWNVPLMRVEKNRDQLKRGK